MLFSYWLLSFSTKKTFSLQAKNEILFFKSIIIRLSDEPGGEFHFTAFFFLFKRKEEFQFEQLGDFLWWQSQKSRRGASISILATPDDRIFCACSLLCFSFIPSLSLSLPHMHARPHTHTLWKLKLSCESARVRAFVHAHTLTHTHMQRAVLQMDGHRMFFFVNGVFCFFYLRPKQSIPVYTEGREREKKGRERGEKKRRGIEGEIGKNIQRSLCFAKEKVLIQVLVWPHCSAIKLSYHHGDGTRPAGSEVPKEMHKRDICFFAPISYPRCWNLLLWECALPSTEQWVWDDAELKEWSFQWCSL